jgi:hypothetical protein
VVVGGEPQRALACDLGALAAAAAENPDHCPGQALPPVPRRNFDEILRVIDSLQLTAMHKVATPVNWKQGEDVVIAGSVSNDQAKEIFGEWAEPKPDIRIVPHPFGTKT